MIAGEGLDPAESRRLMSVSGVNVITHLGVQTIACPLDQW